MKLLVFSDSHGRPQRMLEAADRHADTAAACFYLGDGVRDAQLLAQAHPNLPLYIVGGNCDYGTFEPVEGLAPFGGLLFFYTHGHAFSVKQNLDTLWLRARRKGADIALYGHTHIPLCEQRDSLTLFCPGSIAMPRYGAPSYGLITLHNKAPNFEIIHCES